MKNHKGKFQFDAGFIDTVEDMAANMTEIDGEIRRRLGIENENPAQTAATLLRLSKAAMSVAQAIMHVMSVEQDMAQTAARIRGEIKNDNKG